MNLLKNLLKRIVCGFLSAFLLLSCPVHAYASAAAAAVTAVVYAMVHILAACGIFVSSSMIEVLVGSWSSEADYLKLGAEKKLGAYAQRVYENARNEDVGIAEKFQAIEVALISCVCSGWGDTVTGIRPLVADLKEFLKEAFGYQIEGVWQIPVVPQNHVWGVTQWSTREAYPVPTGPLYPSYPTNSSYTYFLTSYVLSSYGSECMNVQNWYYWNAFDVFGVYDVSSMVLTTYRRNAQAGTYTSYSASAYSVFVNRDGTLRYTPNIGSGWERATMLCSPADAGSLPFPVFSSITDAEHYVATGEIENAYVSGTVPLEVEVFREDVAALEADAVSDTLTFPAGADVAASNLAALAEVFPSGTLEEVQETVGAGGLALGGVSDVPVSGEGTLSDILEGIRALPGSIADALTDVFTVDASEVENQLSVPGLISEKFPFCIPFDVIYLMDALEAEREVPRFVIPIHIDYEFVQYDQEFQVDFSEWDRAVTIFRIMLDLLFCACLIAGTRSLIRG